MSIALNHRLKDLEALAAELKARLEAVEKQLKLKDQDAGSRKAPQRDRRG